MSGPVVVPAGAGPVGERTVDGGGLAGRVGFGSCFEWLT